MTDRFVLDARERCLRFVAERVGDVVGAREWYEGISLERDGETLAAVVYTLMTECDICMHVAARPGRKWLTHDFLRVAFRYPFVQLRLRRVSAFVPSTNRAALKLNLHLGFVREGCLRDASSDGDLIVLGMKRAECRWLGEADGHQKVSQSSRAA